MHVKRSVWCRYLPWNTTKNDCLLNSPRLTLTHGHTHTCTHSACLYLSLFPRLCSMFLQKAAILLSNYTIALSHSFLAMTYCLFHLPILRGFILSVTHPHSHCTHTGHTLKPHLRPNRAAEADISPTERSIKGEIHGIYAFIHKCRPLAFNDATPYKQQVYTQTRIHNHTSKFVSIFAFLPLSFLCSLSPPFSLWLSALKGIFHLKLKIQSSFTHIHKFHPSVEPTRSQFLLLFSTTSEAICIHLCNELI